MSDSASYLCVDAPEAELPFVEEREVVTAVELQVLDVRVLEVADDELARRRVVGHLSVLVGVGHFLAVDA